MPRHPRFEMYRQAAREQEQGTVRHALTIDELNGHILAARLKARLAARKGHDYVTSRGTRLVGDRPWESLDVGPELRLSDISEYRDQYGIGDQVVRRIYAVGGFDGHDTVDYHDTEVEAFVPLVTEWTAIVWTQDDGLTFQQIA